MKMIVSVVLLFYVERGIFQFIETAAKNTAREMTSAGSQTAGRILLPCCEQQKCSDLANDTNLTDQGAREEDFHCPLIPAQTDRSSQQKLELTSPQQAWSYQLLPLQVDSAGRCLGSPPLLPALQVGGGWAGPSWLPKMEKPTYPVYAQPGGGTETGCVSTTLQDFLVPPTILRCLRSDRSTDATLSLSSLGRCVSSEGR